MGDNLKPCPFCGAPARLWVDGVVYVTCTTCSIRTDGASDYNSINQCYKSAVERVIDAWNRRCDD